MERKLAVAVVIILASARILCFPLLYDTKFASVDDHVICRYKLNNVAKGTSVRISAYVNGGVERIVAEKPIEQEISSACADSIEFKGAGISVGALSITLRTNGRICGEMVYIPAGRYSVITCDNTIEQYSLKPFYISKYEITNEQFANFMLDDGYDDEPLWKIEGELMKDQNIGWHYQGLKRLSKPMEWDFNKQPWYSNATNNHPNSPVGGLTWFECYAFTQWIGADMPTWEQLMACFPVDHEIVVKQACIEAVYGIAGAVSEWCLSGIDPQEISCGGCNEMRILENNELNPSPYPLDSYKCPLFRNERLGFRIAIPSED